MYIPAHFKMNNTSEIRNFFQMHPFGMLLINCSEVFEVAHLSIQLHTDDTWNNSTNNHFSKANLHAQALENVESAVEVFIGTNGYISHRWYAAKDNVSTLGKQTGLIQ